MSNLSRYLILLISFWLPLQSVAGTLLHCSQIPAVIAEPAARESAAPVHSDCPGHAAITLAKEAQLEDAQSDRQPSTQVPLLAEVINTGTDSDNCDHCLLFCQLASSLLADKTAAHVLIHTGTIAYQSHSPLSVFPDIPRPPPQNV